MLYRMGVLNINKISGLHLKNSFPLSLYSAAFFNSSSLNSDSAVWSLSLPDSSISFALSLMFWTFCSSASPTDSVSEIRASPSLLFSDYTHSKLAKFVVFLTVAFVVVPSLEDSPSLACSDLALISSSAFSTCFSAAEVSLSLDSIVFLRLI